MQHDYAQALVYYERALDYSHVKTVSQESSAALSGPPIVILPAQLRSRFGVLQPQSRDRTEGKLIQPASQLVYRISATCIALEAISRRRLKAYFKSLSIAEQLPGKPTVSDDVGKHRSRQSHAGRQRSGDRLFRQESERVSNCRRRGWDGADVELHRKRALCDKANTISRWRRMRRVASCTSDDPIISIALTCCSVLVPSTWPNRNIRWPYRISMKLWLSTRR